jgi:uncharacterized protein (DUF983 family)
LSTEISRTRLLWRGATKRCARCGGSKLFHHWFTMVPDCPRCGLHFEREEGYWVGAVAINTIIIGALFLIVFVVAMILTVPDIPWVQVLMIVIPVVGLGPLVTYPFSKTFWVALDMAFLQRLSFN